MRSLLLLVATCALLAGLVVPTAAAGHPGPCWHEYAEGALLGGVQGLRAMLFACNPQLERFCPDVLCP